MTFLLTGHSGQAVGNMTFPMKDLRAELGAEREKQSIERTPQVYPPDDPPWPGPSNIRMLEMVSKSNGIGLVHLVLALHWGCTWDCSCRQEAIGGANGIVDTRTTSVYY